MQRYPWPWLTLLACVAATGNAAAQGVVPGGAPPSQPPAQPTAENGDPPQGGWRLPPLKITGALTYDGRFTRGSTEPSSTAHLVSATLSTSTYLYAPWLATLTGSLGLTSSWSSTEATGLGAGGFSDGQLHDHLRTREQFVTGGARLDIFPRSRFPGEIHYDRQDSRTDSGLSSALDFRRSTFGLSQRYRPANADYTLSGAFDHIGQSGPGFHSTQDTLAADFTNRWKYNSFSAGFTHSRARSEEIDDESRFTTVVAQHAYSPSNNFSLDTTGNLSRAQELSRAGNDLQVMQLSSIGMYRSDKLPLTLTGSARAFVLREDVSGASAESLGVNLGANYQLNPKVRLTATGGVNVAHSGGGRSNVGVNGSVNASYQGDSIQIGQIHYDWSAGAGLGTSFSDGERQSISAQSASAQIGHNATRLWRLGQTSSFSINAGQTLSVSGQRSNDPERQHEQNSQRMLQNTVGATLQRSGDGSSAYARLSYSDSFELGGGHSRFQMLNLQLSGNWDLEGGRSLTGDITYQRTMQHASDFESQFDPTLPLALRTRSSGASGEISFRQADLFGVRRLRFQSRLRLAQDVLKQPGQLVSIPDRETRSWENRVDWNIGRLDTELALRLSQIDGRRLNSLWVRVRRSFSN